MISRVAGRSLPSVDPERRRPLANLPDFSPLRMHGFGDNGTGSPARWCPHSTIDRGLITKVLDMGRRT